MSSAKMAHADIVVPRAMLTNPIYRRRVRFQLYEELQKLGYVEEVLRYERHAKDSPYMESQPDIDWDTQTVIRAVALVRPLHSQEALA
jgi:hypothetical protein